MMVFDEEWAKAWCEAINQNPQYKQAAATWEWPLVLKMEKDPSLGLEEDEAIFLDLYRGECREAKVAGPDDIDSAPYVISADVFTWKQIFDRKLEPISTIMRGRMKLEKGNMSTLSAYVLAAKYLVESALQVEAEFPEAVK
ncbi:putative sterol carrier protein [Melghirimyces profundicolus]|uniref:Putative sterol carrier protein n=1 Tax=Melghirimyces profundicolus TaxID=1242148 RepID=A0A2T6BXI1_9BACL|nr:SCP2 sterol-binding domain-containing protein [Melghirimyces profundicolus]PTX60775.1 putative sterol carrier protein [Melghirimyces profundicolus]